MKTIAALLLAAFALSAQVEFRYKDSAALTASTYAWTIQQPATPSVTAKFTAYSLYCSVACTWTVSRGCSVAASATSDSSAIAAVSPDKAASTTGLSAFKASNASGCTDIKSYEVAAGEEKVIQAPAMRLSRTASSGVHFAVSSITGTAKPYIQWTEE